MYFTTGLLGSITVVLFAVAIVVAWSRVRFLTFVWFAVSVFFGFLTVCQAINDFGCGQYYRKYGAPCEVTRDQRAIPNLQLNKKKKMSKLFS